jgi:hypothetical protein
VPFVIIGGHAVTYHGFVRATEDTDIVFLRTPDSESRLLAALTDLSACWIDNEIDPETGLERMVPVSLPFIRGTRVMMLVTDRGFLDVFDYIPGLPSEPVEQLFATAVGFGRYRYASLNWLRAMKEAAGRRQDRIDLDHLPETP